MKHANHYFNNQVNVDMLFSASDDLPFPNQQSAIVNAEEIDDEMIIAVTQQEAEAAIQDMLADGYDEIPDIDRQFYNPHK